MMHGELTAWPDATPDVLDLDHAAQCPACFDADLAAPVECGDCGHYGPAPVASHVDQLISTAIAHHRVLWEVVLDDDGRASLIWASYPADVWESLMATAARLNAIESFIGSLFGGDL